MAENDVDSPTRLRAAYMSFSVHQICSSAALLDTVLSHSANVPKLMLCMSARHNPVITLAPMTDRLLLELEALLC